MPRDREPDEDYDSAQNTHEHLAMDPVDENTQTTATPSMSPQEAKWWAMSFEELYQHAKSKEYGKRGKESRKSGRVQIIKWLCKKEGIQPYKAPTVTPTNTTPIIDSPAIRNTGAVSHPEAILRTSNPVLQRQIDEEEEKYKEWSAAGMRELAMQRSYQLLKDSHGNLPSKSKKAMANWLASWDVLKGEREKKWWLGDGIDLVNKAKAMGYQGASTKKYDVILWLRTTSEEAEIEATKVAEPTPNKKVGKRKQEDAPEPASKRPAKGSKRLHGWAMEKML